MKLGKSLISFLYNKQYFGKKKGKLKRIQLNDQSIGFSLETQKFEYFLCERVLKFPRISMGGGSIHSDIHMFYGYQTSSMYVFYHC